MEWQRIVENADSPYPEDRRIRYVSGDYEITKEGDGWFWIRRNKLPLGRAYRLRGAKACAEHYKAKES